MSGLFHVVRQAVEELNVLMCLTCLFSNELFGVGFNIFHVKSPIFSYEVSWCSSGIGNHDYILPCFYPSLLFGPLFQLLTEQVGGFNSPPKSSGSLRMALLNSLIPVVEV